MGRKKTYYKTITNNYCYNLCKFAGLKSGFSDLHDFLKAQKLHKERLMVKMLTHMVFYHVSMSIVDNYL